MRARLQPFRMTKPATFSNTLSPKANGTCCTAGICSATHSVAIVLEPVSSSGSSTIGLAIKPKKWFADTVIYFPIGNKKRFSRYLVVNLAALSTPQMHSDDEADAASGNLGKCVGQFFRLAAFRLQSVLTQTLLLEAIRILRSGRRWIELGTKRRELARLVMVSSFLPDACDRAGANTTFIFLDVP